MSGMAHVCYGPCLLWHVVHYSKSPLARQSQSELWLHLHVTSCQLVIDLDTLSCYHVIVSGNDNIRPFNVFHIAWFPILYTLGLNPLFMSTDLNSARVEGGEGKPISNARRLRRFSGKIGLC